MKNTNSSSGKQQSSFSYLLEHILFNESISMRLFRTFVMLMIIVGWGATGAFLIEAPKSIADLLYAMSRYMLAPFAAMLTAFLLGASYLQDVYELPDYTSAARYLLASLFAGLRLSLFLPALYISKGEKNIKDGEISLLDQVGGPGWLHVEPGNVVLLEYLHSPANVVGAGWHFIPRTQHVQEIFSLDDQHWAAKPIIAATRDGIEVAVHDFQFGYRICANHRANSVIRRMGTAPYPFSSQAVRDVAYNRSVRADTSLLPWGLATQFRLDGVVTDVINKTNIDDLFAPISTDPRSEINHTLTSDKIRGGLKNFLGTELTWVNVGRFEVNDEKIREDMKKYRQEVWFTRWIGSSSLLLAQGRAEMISEVEGGRAETTANMLTGIIQALDDAGLKTDQVDENLWNIVLARTAQVIESMTSLGKLDISDHGNESGTGKHES
jgi:hypothetical protein